MSINFLSKVFGNHNSRELKRMAKIVEKINALTEEVGALSDDEIKNRTESLKRRYQETEKLDPLLPEAFALAREAADRALAMRPFDVQLIGGIVLHEGCISEMRTGEGKTLVAILAAYLNALTGHGVHIVTVNDYLARRDAEWMGPAYNALGLSVGVVQSGQEFAEKREAYQADITYGTNHEFGFDYLRDNMAYRLEDKVQRELHYAIVDEVDSILIDEARTPLLIAGPASESIDLYSKINRIPAKLTRQDKVESTLPAMLGGETPEDTGDFYVDEQHRQIELTERGHATVEGELQRLKLLEEGDSLYASSNLSLLHHVLAALKAHHIYKRDVDYMVRDGEVVIIDEHTGRAMEGRRWSEGIHQAVEAKEALSIRQETQTMATTTYQNYFRLYPRLAGMTGTADTEAFEFKQTYGLKVVVVPTHLPMIREDFNDSVYLTLEEKYEAIIADIRECQGRQQPVLIGTASIEASELISKELAKHKIAHNVLNAKQHEREADIIAQAGSPGMVTIATNMAGRGTDIMLGGNWQTEIDALGDAATEDVVAKVRDEWQKRHDQVLDSGGLHIVGTERHESRRIDNQLRGRAGRQGDPGSSRFYLSLEDDLLRLFATPRWQSMMQSIGMERGEAIEAKMVNNTIERAQRKIEGRNFDIRKNLLEYDDVANDQRQVIYQQRNELMSAGDIQGMIESMRETVVLDLIADHMPPQSIPEQWDIEGLETSLRREIGAIIPVQTWLDSDESIESSDELSERILAQISDEYATKRETWQVAGLDVESIEHQVLLQILDARWKEHLLAMDHLRQGIHLRAYAQKQPKQEYKRESFELFQDMLYEVQRAATSTLCRMQIENDNQSRVQERERKRREELARRLRYQSQDANGGQRPEPQRVQTIRREEPKVGRNAPCPCGSGKKYKHCCGKAA
ncbi:MAG: preprotein translocase subunit SecA [Gammaproteobacteria bacterium]|nr:preprotein translocase subunit SecA [Gammaproteobacteria bacterium]